MSRNASTDAENTEIDRLVARYTADIPVFTTIADNLRALLELPPLSDLYHSIRWRVKDPDHLRDKLIRMQGRLKDKGEGFDVTPDNIFTKVNDLAGVRLLHLHTSQFESINRALLHVLEENRYKVLEGPEARVWDIEYQSYFKDIGVSTISSTGMYTSVHYVIEATTKTTRTAEIQVRTLAEELWGEVDHTLNYPEQSTKLACREQIKVLARVTSSCTRLVDSIFATHNEV